MMPRLFATLILLVVAAVAVGCSRTPSSEPGEVVGVIVAVTGESDLESFVVRDSADVNRLFVPDQGFEGTLDQLRELLVAGRQVVVAFDQRETGELVATSLSESG